MNELITTLIILISGTETVIIRPDHGRPPTKRERQVAQQEGRSFCGSDQFELTFKCNDIQNGCELKVVCK